MGNIISYVKQAKENFTQKPFRAVDSLVLSQLSYLNFARLVPDIEQYVPNVRLGDLKDSVWVETLFSKMKNPKEDKQLFYAVTHSPRYRDIELNYYTAQTEFAAEKQFCAITYFLGDGTVYVAYRGTDSTFVGWKEDFNMSFMTSVPAQREGVYYLRQIADKCGLPLRVGGHSKGGNIAVYSAIHCGRQLQNRIVGVFNHDGPGFQENIFHTEEYLNLRERISTTVPQESLVGMLMYHTENYRVVKSSRFWIMQHDPFSWEIKDGNFIFVKDITNGAECIDRTLNQWLCSLSDERRELFADTMYRVLQATGVDSFQKFSFRTLSRIDEIAETLLDLDSETQKYLLQSFRGLLLLCTKNFLKLPFQWIFEEEKKNS